MQALHEDPPSNPMPVMHHDHSCRRVEACDGRRKFCGSDMRSRLFVGATHRDALEPGQLGELVGSTDRIVALCRPEWWTRRSAGRLEAPAPAAAAATASTESRA